MGCHGLYLLVQRDLSLGTVVGVISLFMEPCQGALWEELLSVNEAWALVLIGCSELLIDTNAYALGRIGMQSGPHKCSFCQ